MGRLKIGFIPIEGGHYYREALEEVAHPAHTQRLTPFDARDRRRVACDQGNAEIGS